MRRGVPYYATAPCPKPSATPSAVSLPVLLRVAWRPIQFARQFLIVTVITAVLMLPPAAASTASAAANASIMSRVSMMSGQTAQAAPTSYSAWSCRGVYHVVRRGETLYSIARTYGTTAYRIAVCNGLAAYTVYVGQTLLVPMGRY